ncbi:MAG: Fe-S oxidoreductase [Bacteroidetes bacterium GWC2_33_15]|nr:MAG: Fe-S oxidoreductase [Bacteroidetes bacterium GWC2_33_15]OFX63489.1 MAG: Fe-S oxidoreductase [Bacteroidetes bacterium GWB2_32_14]OFX67244.1 MAG: Fe-S oxidoreductase [Bacteroidetes bacterium GWD2_33_33]HAN17039.1 zinc/iron-chelating domain-containing protein [Bacteroidales bacterium]
MSIEELRDRALKLAPETKIFFAKLKKKKPKNLDDIVHQLHNEVFEEINCLDCANCCKSISPTLYEKDIERLAKNLKMKPSQLVDEYLQIDEENDYVFRQQPCPFLLSDNYCMVYESRPKACREYPHTDRKRFYQILDLTLKNTLVCPAAFDIVEKLKERKF